MLNSITSDHDDTFIPQIAFFPSAGMGHLIPFLRLAAMFSSRNCCVTLITATPTVSVSEATYISSFATAHPQVKLVEFEISPIDDITGLTINDPFFIQLEAIRRSIHLLVPLLSSQPYSAIFTDVFISASVADIANDLCIPNYVVFTSSAKFLSLMTYFPVVMKDYDAKFRATSDHEFDIPGTSPLPMSSIPPQFSDPDHFFTKVMVSNALAFTKAKGIVVNTFESFESEALTALNNGSITSGLPPVLAVGPLEPYDNQLVKKQCKCLDWLNNEKDESVVYISFGSRTAVSKEQIKEIGNGLERSGFKFLWVLKTSKVDKYETEDPANKLLGDEFLERTKSRGMIVKEWVNQEAILAHPAVGVFVSHCGWNSLTEAAKRGMRILAWPQHGDQRVNAEVAVKAGMGICDRTWGWGGEKLVKGEEIASRVKELMEDEKLKTSARKIGEEARRAGRHEGTTEITVLNIIKMLNVEEVNMRLPKVLKIARR